MSVDYKLIGNRIRKRRTELHLTQYELGEKVGITASYVSAIELSERTPSLDVLLIICSNLDITIDYLLSGTVYGELEQDVISKIKLCSSENKKRLSKIIDIFVEEELAK